MRYPIRNPYLVFHRIEGGFIVKNWVSEQTYSVDYRTAFFLANLDGKKNPVEIVPGIKTQAVRHLLDEFQDQGLLCPRKKPLQCADGKYLVPLVYLFPSKVKRDIASFWNSLLLCLTIPVLVFCILSWADNYHIAQNATLLQRYIGMIISSIIGSIIHELSHAAAGLAYKGFVGEMGIGVQHYVIPFAYTLIEYNHIKNRFKRIQILAAGIESQVILAGCLFSVTRSLYVGKLAFVLSSAGIMQIVSVIINMLPIEGTDGFGILKQVGCYLKERIQRVFEQRNRERKRCNKRGKGKRV